MSAEQDDDPIDAIDRRAAEWVVRHDGEPLSAAERQEFAGWIADPGHRAAYEYQSGVWQRYRLAGAKLPGLQRQSAWRRSGGWHFRRRRLPRKLAATALAASVALVVVGQTGNWVSWLQADHATGVGERRAVTLADGSRVQLDDRSAIAVEQTGDQRIVRLLEGTALFTVAPDAVRPFVVRTANGEVTALGTAFAIRAREDVAELTVTEHSVGVRTADGADAIVREGERVHFSAKAVGKPSRIDATAATAWTRGKLIVLDRPLGEVVAEIGRQRRGYWTVQGDASAIRVNGVYDLDHPLDALDALESTLKLRSFRVSDRFIVLSR